MSGMQPVAVYAMKVPPNGPMIPAAPDFAAMASIFLSSSSQYDTNKAMQIRLSMAAIDPTADPEYEIDAPEDKKTPRATLKLVRIPGEMFDEASEDDEDYDDMLSDDEGEDEDESDGEVNGGPSDPDKARKAKESHLAKATTGEETMDKGDDEDASNDVAAGQAALRKILKKGKARARTSFEDDKEESIDLDGDSESVEFEEIVMCTLDPEKVMPALIG